MKLLERILLAEDFTESSRNVVTSAIELAKIFEAKKIAFHILLFQNLEHSIAINRCFKAMFSFQRHNPLL